MPEVVMEEVARYGKRVFVGGCVERGDGSSFRRKAHAHVADAHTGWMCVRSPKRLRMPDGRPTLLIWHELAHLLVGPKNWHNETWKRKMRELCGRVW